METMMTYRDKTTICKDKRVVHTTKLLRTTVLAIFVAVAFTGCIKDELHKTPHPDKGAVRIATDWSGLPEDAAKPESYLLRIGELTQAVSGADNAFKYLLDEGKHTLLVQNMPHGVTVSTTTATIETLADGTLNPLPDYLFSAVSALQVVKDDTLRVNVKMVQSIRTLTLALKLNAGDKERIASASATLTGIAQSINLATGQADGTGAGKVVIPAFKLGSISPIRAEGTPCLIATVRLAGVVSAGKQLLTLNITLTDGTVVPIETNLTEALKDFGREIKPLTLDAVLTLPDDKQAAEVTGTITGWEVVNNGDITIY